MDPLSIQPGSSWQNRYIESFNGKMLERFLNGKLFYTLKEAQIMTERSSIHCNAVNRYLIYLGPPSWSRYDRLIEWKEWRIGPRTGFTCLCHTRKVLHSAWPS